MLTLHKQPKEPVYRAPEYKQFLILRLLNIIMVGVLLLGTLYTVWFVHKNIYNAIGQAEIIISAQDSVITEAIDFEKYEKTKNNWNIKTNPVKLEAVNDPFNLPGAALPSEE